jgi:hypothetical protein
MSKRQSMAATGLVSNVDARIKLRDFIDVGCFAPPFDRLCSTAYAGGG